jgi:hypothetical protein
MPVSELQATTRIPRAPGTFHYDFARAIVTVPSCVAPSD